MYGPTGEDEFDWRGCDVVQWDPEKLSGRANVEGTRMFADSVLDEFDDGWSVDEIAEDYGLRVGAVETIIDFAQARREKTAA